MGLRWLAMVALLKLSTPTTFGKTEGQVQRVMEPQETARGAGCTPVVPTVAKGAIIKHTDVPPLNDPKGVFVLAAHVATRHQGNLLMISLYGIWKYHLHSKIIIVDNASPVPLKSLIPQVMQNKYKDSMLIIRKEISGYEFGAYHSGLMYLSEATGAWALKQFDRIYFMQGQIYLNEPVPQKMPDKCTMTTLMHGPGLPPPKSFGFKVITDHLQSKGLLSGKNLSPLGTPNKGDFGSAHVSFVATLAGAELLVQTGALDAQFTKKETAIWCEPLLGCVGVAVVGGVACKSK